MIAYGEMLAQIGGAWHEAVGARGLLAYPKHALATLYYAWFERRLWSRVDGVVATDERLHARLRRLGYRVRLAYTGIDLGAFAPDAERRATMRRQLSIPPSARVISMVSTVNRQKGVWLGAQVFGSLAMRDPRLHLLIAGDGPDLPRVRGQLADFVRQGRAHLAGAVHHDRVAGYYAASDIFLVPTLRMEGLPLSIIEAAAAGLPTVAADRGGIGSAVRHETTGLLVEPGDARGFEAALGRLLADPKLASTLGEGARELARERFDETVTTERLLRELTSDREVDAAR